MGFRLIPRDDDYFQDFATHIDLAAQMCGLLRQGVEAERIPADLWTRIKKLEHACDDMVRRGMSRLERSFVTPIEREDIHLMIVNIDDVADAIEATASRLDVYDITEPTDDLRAIVGALDDMVGQLASAVRSLPSLKHDTVREATARVDELEEKIDQLFREAQRRLFRRRPEAYDLVRWKEVYDLLESAANHGRHVARTINHILLRHA